MGTDSSFHLFRIATVSSSDRVMAFERYHRRRTLVELRWARATNTDLSPQVAVLQLMVPSISTPTPRHS